MADEVLTISIFTSNLDHLPFNPQGVGRKARFAWIDGWRVKTNPVFATRSLLQCKFHLWSFFEDDLLICSRFGNNGAIPHLGMKTLEHGGTRFVIYYPVFVRQRRMSNLWENTGIVPAVAVDDVRLYFDLGIMMGLQQPVHDPGRSTAVATDPRTPDEAIRLTGLGSAPSRP